MLGRTLTFERVKNICRSDLQLIKGQQLNSAHLEEDFVAFRKTVPVTLFWEQYFFDLQDQSIREATKPEDREALLDKSTSH